MLIGFFVYYQIIRLGLHFICLQKSEIESNRFTTLPCHLFI